MQTENILCTLLLRVSDINIASNWTQETKPGQGIGDRVSRNRVSIISVLGFERCLKFSVCNIYNPHSIVVAVSDSRVFTLV